jgi:NinB protein
VNYRPIILPKEDAVARGIRAQKIATFLSGLPAERAWEVVVRPYSAPRSRSQNAYLWAIYGDILEAGGEEMGGWTKDDLHEFFLMNHFGHEVKTLFGKKRLKPLRRSSKLTKVEFVEFVESILRFMAQRGVYIESPEEYFEREIAA